ncbi:MAG: hypothetical protein R2991_05865 [Thermoanaerobaculia bacterium]
MGESTRRAGLPTVTVALLATLLAIAARVGGPSRSSLPAGEVPRLLGTDAYEHVRRAAVVLGSLGPEDGPVPATAGEKLSPGLWDRVLATPARILEGPRPAPTRIAATAAWLPPLLGGLGILLLWPLGRRLGGTGVAVWTVSLALFFPGEGLPRSALGFADHHALEVVLALACLLGAVVWLQPAEAGGTRRPWALPLCALPTSLLLISSRIGPGAVVASLSGITALAVVLLLRRRPLENPVRRAVAFGGAVAALFAALSLGAPGLREEEWTVRRAVACCLVLVAWPALLWAIGLLQRLGLGRGPLLLATAGLMTTAGLALSRVAPLRELLLLARPRTPLVAEHVPVTWAGALASLGAILFIVPPGIWVISRRIREGSDPAAGTLAISAAALWSAAWWVTRDLGYLPPAFLALVAAPAAAAAQDWLAAGLHVRGARFLAALPVALLVVAPLWPYGVTSRPWVDASRAESLVVYDEADIEAVLWLRDLSPGPTASRSRFSVATPWALGNLVGSYGERKALWARYPTRTASRWLVAAGEGTSLAILERAGPPDAPVRYALLDARSCGSWFQAEALSAGVASEVEVSTDRALRSVPWPVVGPGPTYRRSLAARLCRGARMGHYRLIWQSPDRRTNVVRLERREGDGAAMFRARLDTLSEVPPTLLSIGEAVLDAEAVLYDPRPTPAASIFEIVRGARVRGTARPGARVTASLPLDLGNGHKMPYRRVARAGPDGRFRLLLSQPTVVEAHRSAVRPLGAYRVEVDGTAVAELEVRPGQVRDGAVIALPNAR